MAAGRGAPQGDQGDQSTGLLWGIAGVFIALGIAWFMGRKYIVSFYLTIKVYEVDLLNFFTNHRFDQLKYTLLQALANPSVVQFNDLVSLGTSVGIWLRIPIAIILFLLAVTVYFGNTTRIFNRTYHMQNFAESEKNIWPQISPVVGLNLIKSNLDTGPWAMAMTPMQFCKRYKLLQEVRPERREGSSRKEWDRIDVVLKRGEANRLFALQLGQLWQGIDKLPPHTRALFAVFAARINADSKEAQRLLTQFNASATKKLDYSGVNELLKKHFNTKLVQKVVQSHGYVFTVMASMLAAARDDGVQASADFLWLKPIDRKLWYILNSVGRQTPFAEVAGIFAHWIAEKEAGRKIIVPMVEEATKALDIALKEVVYRPDEV
jgi:intracellular multiplication protein IcmP